MNSVDNGLQRYVIASDGGLYLAETVVRYLPGEEESATDFLRRVAALHPNADEIIVHKRHGVVQNLEVRIFCSI